jgi:hypothetical protein
MRPAYSSGTMRNMPAAGVSPSSPNTCSRVAATLSTETCWTGNTPADMPSSTFTSKVSIVCMALASCGAVPPTTSRLRPASAIRTTSSATIPVSTWVMASTPT